MTRHYYKYLRGEETSTNPMATIFAWTGAFKKRAELDELPDLARFADVLEQACLKTLRSGIMTKDLVSLVEPGFKATAVNTETFMAEIAKNVQM